MSVFSLACRWACLGAMSIAQCCGIPSPILVGGGGVCVEPHFHIFVYMQEQQIGILGMHEVLLSEINIQ